MNIEQHLNQLNSDSQAVFRKTLERRGELGKAHHLSACIYEFTQNISDAPERKILEMVSTQLESATLNMAYGMYRQAFTSLRLALEMGLGAAYFSVHKLELQEWLDGRADIKWSSLTDENNGVLSKRFTKAFFPEFEKDIDEYLRKSKEVYRGLSEYVHGNNETWEACSIKISYDDNLADFYFKNINIISEIILFILCCRYLKSFDVGIIDNLQFLPEEMNHISYVREFFGGPKDL
ncbi:hypothetical protein [Enterovibrio norvegicus]|uniref:hypothetical protein n=1 Tax=Enterovibrio norvegicus TaxID=188144 RepID=UPI000C834B16|nr:hypothetical protein [Enterovibrio norvegicus]PMH63677.1 hypothetical protein BCU62_17665 [Enterovibrio norvegicus]